MRKPPRVLVIIPAYNEEASLGATIDAVRAHLPQAEVVVVNDGSSDATSQVARGRDAFVLDLPYNLGIGTAMQTGFIFARDNGYDLAVQIDGDGQHDPADAPGLINAVLAGKADVAIGTRFAEDRGYAASRSRRLGIALLSWYISLVTRQRTSDPTSGFRAVNRAVIALYADDYPTDYPEPEAIVLLRRHGFRIQEVPVNMRERQGGRSSITTLRAAYYMIKVSLAILVRLLRGRTEGHGR